MARYKTLHIQNVASFSHSEASDYLTYVVNIIYSLGTSSPLNHPHAFNEFSRCKQVRVFLQNRILTLNNQISGFGNRIYNNGQRL